MGPTLESDSAEEIICVQKPEGVEDLDEAGYLAANPDIGKAGMCARDHFKSAGCHEGRIQWTNQDRIAELRERKIRALRFRRPPATARDYGQPANFITPELTAEFGIPAAPRVSANVYGGPFIDEIRANPSRLCLDVGAGLRYSCLSNVVNTEIYPWISTDVLCVGEDLPFDDDQFDYVTCLAVLEHTRRPWEVAREICRVLKPGGKLLVDYPFLQAVHGYPNHYFNATPEGAISLFALDCDIISSTIEGNNHPIYAIWWPLSIWQHGLETADRERFEQLTIKDILAESPDGHIGAPYCANLNVETQRLISAGSTVIARKREAASRTTGGTPSTTASNSNSRSEPALYMRQKIAALEAEVAALRGSRSWRITAPLRELHRSWQQLRLRGSYVE